MQSCNSTFDENSFLWLLHMTAEPLVMAESEFLHTFPFNNQIPMVVSSQNKGLFTPEGTICPHSTPHSLQYIKERNLWKYRSLFFSFSRFQRFQDKFFFKDQDQRVMSFLSLRSLCKKDVFPNIWGKVGRLHHILTAGLQRFVVGETEGAISGYLMWYPGSRCHDYKARAPVLASLPQGLWKGHHSFFSLSL